MKPGAFAYHAPGTIAEAVGLLADRDNARVLAGGQSLMPMMNFRYALPDVLVDINRVAELDHLDVGADNIEIGAMTRQRRLEFSPEVARACPLLAEAVPNIGHRQTRNRGTIGGSLAHADPAAELPTVAMALDGVVRVRSVRGERAVPIGDFMLDYMVTALEPDELLCGISLPTWPVGHGWCFLEFARRHGDFALVSVAVLICVDADAVVRLVSLTVAGLAAGPARLRLAEAVLLGERLQPRLLAEAARLAGEIEANGDVHASAGYRQHLARGLMGQALMVAVGRAVRA